MRYNEVDDITFTDTNGIPTKIKDMREYPTYELLTILNIKEDDMLDEIMTREELYGEKNEDISYAIFDMNRVKLTESNFDISKLVQLKIPLVV